MSGTHKKKTNVRIQKVVHKTTEVSEDLLLKNVPVDMLLVDSPLPCDIYLRQKGKLKRVLEKGKNFTVGIKAAFANADVTDVLISQDDVDDYYRYIDGIRQNNIREKQKQLRAQSADIYSGASDAMKNLLREPESSTHLNEAIKIVDKAVDFVLSDSFSINALTEASSKDYHTCTHSVDTAIFALGFGAHLGLNKNDLYNLGQAALFHDIGKSRVDPAIIDKDGILTEDEFDQVKKHSLYGYFILKSHKITNQDVLNGVRYHHEKYDGSGYPDKLRGKEIPLFAQIIAMADVFSAISTQKSYRDALSSFDAINIMKNSMIHAFDGRLFMEFIQFMGPKEIAKGSCSLF